MAKEVVLKVAEARQRDVGRGKIRMDDINMREIGITTGDVVEIRGRQKTGAIAWPAYIEDQGAGIVRMDGIIRRNAKVSLEENVRIRKAQIKVAKTVNIAPTRQISLDYGFEAFVKRKLLGYPVSKNDTVLIPILGRSIPFVVNSTTPTDIVLITDTTKLNVSEKPVSEIETGMPGVSYEDIGGLSDAIQRIREMVELPLKHPELFKKLGIDPPKGVLLHGPPGTGKTLIAKAVANESEAHFIPIQGPEIMSKFYGECVAKDSLVFTNGNGLKSIGKTIQDGKVHSIAGLNFDTGEINLLPVKELFDKGTQITLKIITPHGQLEVTPSSRLLTLNDGELNWIYANELKVGDRIASPRTLRITNTETPLVLNSLKDNTLICGELVKILFSNMSEYGKSGEYAKELGVSQRKFETLKYSKGKIPALYVKKLFSLYPIDDQYDLYLEHNRKVPLYMTEDFMYILGLLAGDGHLRYSYSHGTVTQIILTSKDEAVKNRYIKAIKNTFNITPQKYTKANYSYYFNSRPIGDLLYNLGLPVSKKSETVTVPHYVIKTPVKLLKSYLQGLFDSDGGVQFISEKNPDKRSIQITYTSKSRKLIQGIKLCLLRFDILSTISHRKRDGTWRLFISNNSSIENFKKYISFNHQNKREKIMSRIEREYSRPTYDRIPIAKWIYMNAKKVNIGHRELLRNGINPTVKGLTIEQLRKAYILFKEKGLDSSLLDKINYLLGLKVIWTPIRRIERSQAHVYDFEVPKHHNFIANGLLVHNSEARLREIFKEAEDNAPSIIFIDEIDAIAPKREEVTGEVERRVVAQILALMDGLESRGETIVIGATNRPNALDPALRRPGRFDREIEIGVPDMNERLEILQIHTRRMPGIDAVDTEKLAVITHGFVGADLAALGREAAMKKLREILPEINLSEDTIPPTVLDNLKVEDRHFEDALKEIHPSAIREVFIEVPNVKWDNIGGMDSIKQELIEIVEWPLKQKDSFKRLGINPPRAVLLFGAPGTGKTLLAKALATESQVNFISVKGPELLSKWVGESEKAIREVFRKARTASPALVFFDEIDAVATRRGSGDSSGVNERVISQLLTELAGIEPLRDVVVLAATNRPDMIDPALLRPGRFDRVVYIPPPDEESRRLILNIHTKNMPLAEDVNLDRLAKETEYYVGADLEAICREAGMIALREGLDTNIVEWRHFEASLSRVHSSCTPEMMKWYENQESQFRRRIALDSQPTVPLFG